jgi:hypothetical protein
MAKALPYYATMLKDFNKKYSRDDVAGELGAWMHKKKIVEFVEETGGGYCRIVDFTVYKGDDVLLTFWNREMAEDFIRDISTLKSIEKVDYKIKRNTPDFMRHFETEADERTVSSMHLMEIILESGEDPIKALEEIEYKLQAKNLGLL